MTFEEDFPSFKPLLDALHPLTEHPEELLSLSCKSVEKNCLDKQRVKEAINSVTQNIIDLDPNDKEAAYCLAKLQRLEKELGL